MERNRDALYEADYKVHYKTKVVSPGFESGKIDESFAVCTTFTECKEFKRSLEADPVYKIGRITKMIIRNSIWFSGPDGKKIEKPRKRKPAVSVTYQVVRQYLKYDPDKGTLVWRMGTRAGQNAIRIGANNQPFVSFLGAERSAKRICWMLHNKREPINTIRNISGQNLDLRAINLQEKQ